MLLQGVLDGLLDDYLFDADFCQLSSQEQDVSLRELYTVDDVLTLYEDDNSANV